MIIGVCKYCGCTPERSCPGGCSWVTEEATICTTCLPKMTAEELLHANALDHQSVDGAPLTMLVTSLELSCVAGLVQLALRHLGTEEVSHARDVGQAFVTSVAECFAQSGLFSLYELIRRGNDPAHDVPTAAAPPPTTSPLILP